MRLQSTLTAVSQAGGPANNAGHDRAGASVGAAQPAHRHGHRPGGGGGWRGRHRRRVQAQVDADAQTAGGQAQLQSQLASVGGSLDAAARRDPLIAQRAEARGRVRQAARHRDRAEAGLAAPPSPPWPRSTPMTPRPQRRAGSSVRCRAVQVQGDDPAYAAAVLALKQGQHTDPPVHDAQGYDIVELTAATPTTLTLRHIIVDRSAAVHGQGAPGLVQRGDLRIARAGLLPPARSTSTSATSAMTPAPLRRRSPRRPSASAATPATPVRAFLAIPVLAPALDAFGALRARSWAASPACAGHHRPAPHITLHFFGSITVSDSQRASAPWATSSASSNG